VNRHLPTIVLAVGHGSVDLYQGLVPVLIPFLVLERHYDYAAVAGFVLAATALSAAVQPLFGLVTDRWQAPWLVPVSMAACGGGTLFVGLVDSYLATLAAIAVTGLGVAAYHPQAARTARIVTGGGSVPMSWFSLGGSIGFMLAPVVAAPVLAIGGLAATPWLAAPAVLGLATTVLRARGTVHTRASRDGTDDWPAFRRLTAVVVLRSIVYVGLSGFVGLHVASQVDGGSGVASAAVFALFAGSATGTVLGGWLAKRWRRVHVMRVAYLAAAFAVAGVVVVPGPAVFGFVVATSLLLAVPFSLHITLGQDYLPSRPGTASGVTLGLAVSAGGLFAPVLGAVADATSLRLALAVLAPVALVAWWLSRRLAEPRVRIP
jgi:FSR family fosmidomycin resistance protein-like MFS transporter